MPINQWFSKEFIRWNAEFNHRKLHFKGIKDPYKIWISEIIMQQTKVEQGEKYYLNITKRYPTLSDLASADEQELFSMWQGLGYYNRCRNMLTTANYIQEHHGGIFPKDYDSIRALKGIGDYTAAAIASFAYDLPYAVVDGNVVRILSRIFGVSESFHTTSGKKYFQELATSLLYTQSPSTYNQAMMDFGATVCKPKSPECTTCPFRTKCVAFKEKAIEDYPVKKIKKPLKVRYFHFFVAEEKDQLCIVKRTQNDIWNNLYILPYIESDNDECPLRLAKTKKNAVLKLGSLEQILSHQRIIGQFYKVPYSQLRTIGSSLDSIMVPISALTQYGFPKLIISFFKNNHYL